MAFLLVLLIVAFWTASGWAVLQAAGQHRNLLRALLLAPAIGMAALVLLPFELYRLGLPLRLAAPLATAFSRSPSASGGSAPGPTVPLAAFAGAPLFTESFAWVAFCNDDMANYVLSARRLCPEACPSARPF
ncbi:MAG: hypothetical protein ACK58M_11960 [Acidobacteriota bacterium]|jgi:hypothetical protein|nr:hypothetical protein [Bryobacteraceae bacterium CoA2 C42]MCA2965299.1 hypothetical protein [Acidobacteriaceae bacterium]